ncbi:MAG: peptidoglycan editing factor PgeF [Firmicutes bacterium]|nr:peptidoglycan editing factor PgeF [Bacillota bacterium]
MNEIIRGEGAAQHIEVYADRPEIKAFFATKASAKGGWPFCNAELFAEAGVSDYVQVGHFQTHSDHVQVIDAEVIEKARVGEFELELPDDIDDEKRAKAENECMGGDILFFDSDGAITDQKGVLLTSMHADCIPLFFYDPVREAIGMVHSGWKGTVKEIGRITSLKMQEVYGCKPENLLVHIGPGISQCCFEVDEDVYEMFKEPKYTTKGIKYYIDLKEYNLRMLMDTGIPEENITISEHCTCCEPELFASYRYDGSMLRMGGGIVMLDK